MNNLKQFLTNRTSVRTALAGFAYWYGTIVYLELVMHLCIFGGLTAQFLYTAGFTVLPAALVSLLTGFLPKKANFPVSIVLTVLLVILYGSQVVYNAIFGSMYSLAMTQLGGDALTAFWRETLLTMSENILPLLALFLPVIALLLLKKFAGWTFCPTDKFCRIGQGVGAVAAQVIVVLCLTIGGTGYFTNYYFYNSADTTTDQAAERFGLVTAMRLELTGRSSGETSYYAESTTQPESGADQPAIEYNVLDIDFDALNELTDSEKVEAINNYCASLSGTNKNEYTGLLADYNLIVLCAESFATAAIDPDLTPTLYKLANEGIIFSNYYNTFPNTTTDGEYALCQGLYPDTSRGKAASSFYASRNSYLPYTLGNVFSEQAGIQAYGYHNYLGSYYGRDESHPNMGYKMKFAGSGMTFTTSWPSSDLEMMKQSVDDYIGQDQFHAYYMTFSGHYKYDRSINPMANRNWSQVQDLSYSNASKCYLSCNIELEKAMAYLMERLEAEGVADKTAIVLTGDHFPYGLADAQYSELIGYDIDEFSKYKSTLIFWVGGLEENIIVDEYCCNVDILPTILNLWGFEYDSRMLAGTDVFSDGTHISVLIDKSFLTDKVWFNADTGKATWLVDESEVPEGYLENMISLVKTKFSISSDILNTAYYNFVFEKGNVKINRNAWVTYTAPEEKVEEETTPEVTPPTGTGADPTVTPTPDVTPDPTVEPTVTPSTAPDVTVTPEPSTAPEPTPGTVPTETPSEPTPAPIDPPGPDNDSGNTEPAPAPETSEPTE